MSYDYKNVGIILLVVALLLLSVSIGAYAYVFYQSPLSTELSDWGAFGSYIGGVIGGAITPLALVGAVLALFQQHNSSNKDKNRATAADILKTIERVEDSIDNELKERTYRINYVDINHSIDSNAYKIITNPLAIKTDEVIPLFYKDSKEFLKNIMDTETSDKERFELIDAYGLFSSIGGKFTFIKELIEKHQEITKNNVTSIFYKRKYKHAVSLLIKRGYPIKSWDSIDKFKNS